MKCNFVSNFKQVMLLFFIMFCLLTSYSQAATLQKIDAHTSELETQIDLQLDENVRYKKQSLTAKGNRVNRCYIDLFDTQRDPSLPTWLAVESKQLRKVRTGIHANKLRVVFDLKEQYACDVVTTDNPFTVHISFRSEPDEGHFPAKEPAQPAKVAAISETKKPTETKSASDFHPEKNTVIDIGKEEEPETELFLSEFDSSEDTQPAFWGWLKVFIAHDTEKETAEDNQFTRMQGRVGTDWDNEISSEQSLHFAGAIDIDRIFYDSEKVDEETEFNLHETFLQLNGSNWDISFGKQRVRWGKSDQLSPVDSINPQDYRQSIAVDLEERAIPSWLLRSRWYGNTFELETILQPWFQKSEIEYFDSDWALYRNLRQSIIAHPTVPTGLKTYASSIQVHETKPANTLENMSAGLRITANTEQTDFALSYHYGWETLPTVTSFPVSGVNFSGNPNTNPASLLAGLSITSDTVQTTYKRQQTFGVEWETARLDPLGFRGEIAHTDKIAFLSSDLTSIRRKVTQLVTGVDYTSETEWYINAQASWQHIHEYVKNILYFKEDNVSLFGEISKPVWRGNVELGLGYSYMATDKSSYLQPSILFKYFQNIECELGAMIYSGKDDSILGSYNQADQVYATMKITF